MDSSNAPETPADVDEPITIIFQVGTTKLTYTDKSPEIIVVTKTDDPSFSRKELNLDAIGEDLLFTLQNFFKRWLQ